MWSIDSGTKGAKRFMVGCKVAMYEFLKDNDLHAYDQIQTSHCYSGGDKTVCFYVDIDSDEITEKVVWTETLKIVFLNSKCLNNM